MTERSEGVVSSDGLASYELTIPMNNPNDLRQYVPSPQEMEQLRRDMRPETREEQRARLASYAAQMSNAYRPSWGQQVEWTSFDGRKDSVSVSGCETLAEARQKAFDMAVRSGWKPKRWWQWWRWSDTPDLRRENTASETRGNRAPHSP
jgi:hypothetical protein